MVHARCLGRPRRRRRQPMSPLGVQFEERRSEEIVHRKRLLGVTGGPTGISEAVSKRFASAVAAVPVNGLPTDPAETVIDENERSGGRVAASGGDIS